MASNHVTIAGGRTYKYGKSVPIIINRKALLFFKDENPNDFIKKFIGLRSKLYVIKPVSNQIDKKCKGYNKKFRDTLLT